MKKTSTYRTWLAGLLALLIVQVTVLRDLHHLLPHQHEEHPTCDSDSAHLHTAEYVHAECLICFFHFAPLDFQEVEMRIFVPEISEAETVFSFQNVDLRQIDWHNFLRGPPRPTA